MNKKECDEKRMLVKRRLYLTLMRFLFLVASPTTMRQMSFETARTLIDSYSNELSEEEAKYIEVESFLQPNGAIAVVGKNFFSALLIHGIYIPYFLVKYKDVVCHPAYGTIKFDENMRVLVFNIAEEQIDW